MSECENHDQDFVRLPGLFRRWELEDVLQVGADFHLEDAGETADGTKLLAVYWRRPPVEDSE